MSVNNFHHLSVYYFLLSFKGIGPKSASLILAKLGISKSTLYSDLSPFKLDQLNFFLSYLKNLTSPDGLWSPIDINFNKYSSSFIKELFLSRNYRSSRLLSGFPANGQRTRSNAKTSQKIRFFVSASVA